MRLLKKSLSKINLTDLLRRKKSTLENFLYESGIVTYDKLVERCNSIGVVPPSEEMFSKALGDPVTPIFSSPMDGIVVLDPLPSTDVSEESSYQTIGTQGELHQEPKVDRQKKKRLSSKDSGKM